MAKKADVVANIDFNNDVEPVDEPIFQETQITPKDPTPLDQEWEKFILSKFFEHELVKGRPKVVGMRRVIKTYFGPIIENLTECVEAPSLTNGQRCTAKNTITVFVCKSPGLEPGQEPYEITYSDIADAWWENISGLEFQRHPGGMAGTRSESRTLRKILSIATPAAEEISSEPADQGAIEGRISESQITRIDIKCAQLDIDVMKFINIGKGKYKKIENVPVDASIKMLKTLVEYENNDSVPEEISGYNPDWRK